MTTLDNSLDYVLQIVAVVVTGEKVDPPEHNDAKDLFIHALAREYRKSDGPRKQAIAQHVKDYPLVYQGLFFREILIRGNLFHQDLIEEICFYIGEKEVKETNDN